MQKRLLLSSLAAMLTLNAWSADYNVKVKITNTEGKDISLMPMANIYGEDFKQQGFSMSGEWTFSVPAAGEYCFIASCDVVPDPASSESETGNIVVPITVIDSNTEASADLSSVKNRMSMQAYLPGGELIQLPSLDWETGVPKGGNVTGKLCQTAIIHSKFGNIGGGGASTQYEEMPCDARWVNDLDENFSIVEIEFFSTKDGYLLTSAKKENGLNSDLTFNLGKDYDGEFNAEFAMSPIGEENRKGEIAFDDYMCDLVLFKGNDVLIHTSLSFPFSSPKGTVRYDSSIKNLPMGVGVKMSFNDVVDASSGLTIYPITDLPVNLSGESEEYFGLSGVSNFRLSEDGFLPQRQGTGHPGLSHKAEQRVHVAGDNTPLTVLVPQFVMDWENPANNHYTYQASGIGRLGEIHIGYYTRMNAEEDKVTVDCVEVEGIKGRTEIIVSGIDKDPRIAEIQQVQFRDRNTDKLQHSFAKREDGRMMLVGADYIPNLDDMGNIMNYTFGEIDLKAEYSAYGEDDWHGIEVKEVPEMYFEPGYGYFYEGSLAQVNVPSENGWYDLRLTTTGKEGNSSVQLISPAFRIESSESGVTSVKEDNITEWYTLQGVKVDNPEKGIYLHKGTDGWKKVIRK